MTSNPVEIALPATLGVHEALSLSGQLAELPQAEAYHFQFGNMRFVEPFGLLLSSDAIDRFRRSRPRSKFLALGHEKCGYAGHMGFFKTFGLQSGRAPGEAAGSESYLPIDFVDCDDLRQRAGSGYAEVGEFIDDWSKRVAALLVQTDVGALFDTVQYSLREVVRNVVEHSESKRFGYCGQFWARRNRVQIGLIDRGVGLRQTLSANPRLTVESDRDAVQFALMPGVSRKGILPKSRASHDPWANSGFGLYMTSRLCSEGGSFVLSSGSAAVELTNSVKRIHTGACSGTALQLELDLENVESLSARLTRFREEGIHAARTYFKSEHLTASLASTMLNKNFNPSE